MVVVVWGEGGWLGVGGGWGEGGLGSVVWGRGWGGSGGDGEPQVQRGVKSLGYTLTGYVFFPFASFNSHVHQQNRFWIFCFVLVQILNFCIINKQRELIALERLTSHVQQAHNNNNKTTRTRTATTTTTTETRLNRPPPGMQLIQGIHFCRIQFFSREKHSRRFPRESQLRHSRATYPVYTANNFQTWLYFFIF